MSSASMRMHKPGRRRFAAIVTFLTTIVLTLTGSLAVLPAAAAPGDPEFMAISKSVTPSELTIGEPFSYTITVACSQESCVDAVMLDQLPAELDGYLVQNVASTPPSQSVLPREVEWNVDGAGFSATAPAVLTADTLLRVRFTENLGGGAVGMQEGASFSITLSLQVPADLLPGTDTITNTARTESANADHVDDSADITITVPRDIAVGVEKTWAPSPQAFNPGNPSTIDLAVSNKSNGPVETLVLQEPATAPVGATTLDASNPFTITNFSGLSGFAMPAGAETVQVDAYVLQGGTWQWVTGTPAATAALPAGVTPADVGGVRLTFEGAAIAQDAAGEISLDLTQRATHRDTGDDLSTASHTVNNVAEGSAAVAGRDPVTTTGNASYTVNPVSLGVDVSKNIVPNRIAAGDSATASILATNSSDAGVNELSVSDLGYFTADVTFGGFTAAPTWPSQAATAQVRYVNLADGTIETVTFTEGTIPAAPSQAISGFEIVYTGTNGSIDPGASSLIQFTIDTAESATGAVEQLSTTNRADGKVVAPNGLDAEDFDTAPLTLVKPAVEVSIDKSIAPKHPNVEPGDGVVVSLRSTMTMISDYITPTQLVVEDALTADERLWDAFNLTEIAQTQIPSGTAVTVHVRDAAGTWHAITTRAAQASPYLFAMSGAQITAALPGALTLADLTGVRFTFDNADGFSRDTIITPLLGMEARSTLRSTGASVTDGPGETEVYENRATVEGTGTTGSGTPLTADDDDVDDITVYTPPGGPGPIDIEKTWLQSSVHAQSDQVRSTRLDWRVRSGFEQVVITDPSVLNDVAGTAFDAFNLVALRSIAASSTTFSNGWYLRYDSITAVELYDGAAWTTVTPPAGGWVQGGAFAGYTLSGAQAASTTAVRVTFEENTAARQAAADAVDASDPAFDPFAPAPGTGVAQSSVYRQLVLDWQIRTKKRSDGSWVTSTATYNVEDGDGDPVAGTVNNEVLIEGIPESGPTATDRDSSSIQIVDPDLGVLVTKSVTPTAEQRVPVAGTAPELYPNVQFRVSARNDSVAKASYLRVMDPPLCSDAPPVSDCETLGTVAAALANPFPLTGIDWLAADRGNPFDRFDLRGLTIAASIGAQVDLTASTVWLLRYSGGTYTATEHTAAAANAMTAADLADVVGVSVTFQGSDPATTGGTITAANQLTMVMDARLRTHERASGDAIVLSANETLSVTNRVAAQPFDPVLNDGATTHDLDDASARLTGGVLRVAATKSISPTTLLEPQRDTEVTVTLGANHSTSTLPPAEVRLTDDVSSSPEFWDKFDLTGLGTISAPAGADRVIVSVYGPFGAAGAMAWQSSAATPIADATLPVSGADLGDVQGVRFIFERADGAFFSSTVPSQAWSTSARITVQLRDELRSTGEAIEMSGTVENTVEAVSDRRNGESVDASRDASITLDTGSFELAVHKLTNDGNRFGTAGLSYPWDLVFENTGTGYLTITELRDSLPAHLLYLGDTAPVFTVDPDGMLPEPESVELLGSDLVFTWPADGRLMAPGEQFGIRVMLELQPGLTTGQRTTNEFTVATVETLARCGNIVPGGATTGAWADDPTTCGTSDYIQPATGKNLYTVKGVQGSLPGAIHPTDPAATCAATLSSGGEQFFRSPCAANSVVDGVDSWLLRVQNSGTENVDSLVLFDQLPQPGDQYLIGGASRGSQFRPQLEGAPVLTVPAGVTYTLEVTEQAGACAGTWSNLQNHAPCEQNGETWVEADADTDWAAVRGLRATFDFSGAGGVFSPGQLIDVTYDSRNVPTTTADTDGAPVVVPVADAFAWNQFGVKHRFASDSVFSKLTPARVGTHLVTGPIQIDKLVTGAAAAYAADTFLIDVVCTVAGAPLDLGQHAVVELDESNHWSQRIDGIPVGAECLVTEQGDVGEFGETSRSGADTTLTIELPALAGGEVPAAQVATITNEYLFSGLEIRKSVDTAATAGSFGPFDFTLSCVSLTGVDVDLGDGTTELAFQLADGEVFTAPAGTIPVGAECLVTEVGADGADGVVVVGTSVTDHGDGSASVVVGLVDAEVTFTNSFDSGVLRVEKEVVGEGAALYGAGPFGFEAVCTYQGETVLDETFTLEADTFRTFGTFPTGTDCVVTETAPAGASSSQLVPADGAVTIVADVEAVATVVATNTFELGGIEVTKLIDGDKDAEGASGPFTVELVCTWQVDGERRDIEIPGGATRVLMAPDALTTSFGQLPLGAECTITETETQDAESTSIVVRSGDQAPVTFDGVSANLVVSEAGTNVSVDVTNVFQSEDDAPPGDEEEPPVDKEPPGDDDLALTGVTVAAMLGAVLLAILLGVGLVVTRRRVASED